MKHIFYYFGIYTLILLLLPSCEKYSFFEKEGFFEKETNFSTCHNEQKWDSISVENSLIGTWEYTYRSCIHTSSGFVSEGLAYDSLKVYANHTLQLIDNDTTYKSAQWTLYIKRNTSGRPLFYLGTDPDILEGDILFCEDRLVFKDVIALRQVCSYYHKRLD